MSLNNILKGFMSIFLTNIHNIIELNKFILLYLRISLIFLLLLYNILNKNLKCS
jgi:hypothetical protein